MDSIPILSTEIVCLKYELDERLHVVRNSLMQIVCDVPASQKHSSNVSGTDYYSISLF